MTRKQIRNNRLWKHFVSFIPRPCFKSDLSVWSDYNPELYRKTFFRYQSLGRKALTAKELEEIKPLIDGQKLKEITINSLVQESFEWDSKGWGWIYPWLSALSTTKDRLMFVALYKIMQSLKDCSGFGERLVYFMNHPSRAFDESAFTKRLAEHKLTYGW